MADVKTEIVGTWRLVSAVQRVSDGEDNHPWGEEPVGYITYTADGRMSVQISAAARPVFASGDRLAASDEERLQAFDSYLAYCGTYEVLPDRVVHRVEMSLFPNNTGTDQVRFPEIQGDTLTLTTAPVMANGKERTAKLVWRRVPAR